MFLQGWSASMCLKHGFICFNAPMLNEANIVTAMRTECGSLAVNPPLLAPLNVFGHLMWMISTSNSPMNVQQTTSWREWAAIIAINMRTDGKLLYLTDFENLDSHKLMSVPCFYTGGSFTVVELMGIVMETVSGLHMWIGLMKPSIGPYPTQTIWWAPTATTKINMSKYHNVNMNFIQIL